MLGSLIHVLRHFRIFIQFCDKGTESGINKYTVKILKFGTPQTIAIIVLKIEKFDVTLQ